MSQVKDAVLELTGALHDWRTKQGPEQLKRLILASDVLAGLALHLETTLERIVQTPPADRCKCGGVMAPCHFAGASVPITKCTSCDAIFAVVRLNGGPDA